MANMLSPLATPAATRDVLEEHGLSTKHALGQNFLVNDAILQKIVELAQLDASDDVLEVGPGIGTLTIALLKCAGRVVSVERDADLPAVLEDTLEPWADRFALISKDALELTEEEVHLALAKCAVSNEGEGVCFARSSARREQSSGLFAKAGLFEHEVCPSPSWVWEWYSPLFP